MLNRRAAVQIGIIVVALVATGGTSTSLRAQNDPARQGGALSTADQILARYEQALGGAAALAKINTRITRTRRFQDVGSPEDHELVRFTKRPADPNARLLSIMSHSSLDGLFLRWSNGCDGKTGWNWSGRTDPSGIPRDATTLTGGLCEERLAHYGYFPLDLARMKRNVQRFEVKGITYIFQPEALPVGAIAGGKGPDLVPAGSARETYLVLGGATCRRRLALALLRHTNRCPAALCCRRGRRHPHLRWRHVTYRRLPAVPRRRQRHQGIVPVRQSGPQLGRRHHAYGAYITAWKTTCRSTTRS